jgi:hypothetical protein
MFWLWYDMPSLFLFMLGLLLLYEKKWWLYYPVFILATLNRETSCFLTLIYAVTISLTPALFPKGRGCRGGSPSPQPSPLRGEGAEDRRLFSSSGLVGEGAEDRLFSSPSPLGGEGRGEGGKWRPYLAHITVQFAIWLAIKLFLSHLYAGNPGVGTSMNNTVSNFKVLVTQPQMVLVLLSSIAYLWIPVWLYFGSIKNLFVRRACLVTPLFFAVMFVSGNLPELRIYGEMIPVILPAFLLIVAGKREEFTTNLH